jgi:hypothetical protein
MKDSLRNFGSIPALFALFITGAVAFQPQQALAVTSPYVTQQTNVPLNQASSDTVNGVVPFFSHSVVEGGTETLTDATSPNTPDGNVILGPDNTWVGVTWDFGAPPAGYVWRLDRFDAWISAGDNLRKGYQADLSVSSTGDVNDFSIIPNSKHWVGLSQNDNFNHIRYDFPTNFIASGVTNTMDRYPVEGFRYLRLNSRGDSISGTDWQTRFVEIDIWVTAIPDPETPRITSITHAGGDVTLSWNAIEGRSYTVEYKSEFDGSGWSILDARLAGSTTETFTDSATSGGPQRFYQVVLQP